MRVQTFDINQPVDAYEARFGHPVGPWHQRFAWHPVDTIDRGWVWLRRVWSRRCQSHDYLDGPTLNWTQSVVDKDWSGDHQPVKVEIEERLNEPTVCKVWRNGALVFHGKDLSASMSR